MTGTSQLEAISLFTQDTFFLGERFTPAQNPFYVSFNENTEVTIFYLLIFQFHTNFQI